MTTTEKPMHTPTPWSIFDEIRDSGWVDFGVGYNPIGSTYMLGVNTNKANAAYIVRAVNSYEAMREALGGILNMDKWCDLSESEVYFELGEYDSRVILDARAALALADKE